MTSITPTAEEQKIADELFDLFDKDKNNVLTEAELDKGLKSAGSNPTKADLKQIKDDMKITKGQTISRNMFRETIAYYYRKKKTKKEEEEDLAKAFKVFDRNKNGYVEMAELKAALTKIGEKLTLAEVKEMFASLDVNKDGKIEYKEFIKLYTKDIPEK